MPAATCCDSTATSRACSTTGCSATPSPSRATFTNPPYRGSGLAGELVAFAVDDVEATSDRRIVPSCWYVGEWFDRHPDRAAHARSANGLTMIVGYSAAQVRAAEAPHLAAGEPLMRRAAAALAAVLRRVLARDRGPPAGPVVLLVGSGDNGGDALFAGAELAGDGVDGDRDRRRRIGCTPTARRRRAPRGCGSSGGDGRRRTSTRRCGRRRSSSTGSSAPARVRRRRCGGRLANSWPRRSRSSRARHPGRRRRPAERHPPRRRHACPTRRCCPPTVTVTFGAVKAGLLLEPAAGYAGRVELVDLGLGPDLATMTPLVTIR